MTTLNDKEAQFEAMGGRAMLIKINSIFYDKVYSHPWIGQYFQAIPQDVIESQQVDFMTGNLGGPQVYCGKFPIPAHINLNITEELFDLRQKLLFEAFEESEAPQPLIDKWIQIDEIFRRKLVKKDISECEKRFFTDSIQDFPNPANN